MSLIDLDGVKTKNKIKKYFPSLWNLRQCFSLTRCPVDVPGVSESTSKSICRGTYANVKKKNLCNVKNL